MKIKFPGELVPGDIVVYNKNRFVVDKYIQGAGMGHFIWGEYGILYYHEFTTANYTKLLQTIKDKLIGPSELQLYIKYPLVVLEESDIGLY